MRLFSPLTPVGRPKLAVAKLIGSLIAPQTEGSANHRPSFASLHKCFLQALYQMDTRGFKEESIWCVWFSRRDTLLKLQRGNENLSLSNKKKNVDKKLLAMSMGNL